MALSNYAELQTAIAEQCERATDAGFVAKVPDFISLAESTLNRELAAIETDATLTGVVNNRRIDVSSVAIVQPVALYLAETGNDEVPVQLQADGTFAYLTTAGRPARAAFDGSNIDFDRPLDSAYPFRLRYRQKLALATTDPNWLLTNHPDVYLAAAMVWALAYMEDWQNSGVYKSQLESDLLPRVRNSIAQSKRGTLRVDPALASRGGGMSLSEWTNG